jgi:hypothetical protein
MLYSELLSFHEHHPWIHLGTEVYQEVPVSSRLRSIFRFNFPSIVVLILQALG